MPSPRFGAARCARDALACPWAALTPASSRTRVVACVLCAMWAALGAPTLLLSATLSHIFW